MQQQSHHRRPHQHPSHVAHRQQRAQNHACGKREIHTWRSFRWDWGWVRSPWPTARPCQMCNSHTHTHMYGGSVQRARKVSAPRRDARARGRQRSKISEDQRNERIATHPVPAHNPRQSSTHVMRPSRRRLPVDTYSGPGARAFGTKAATFFPTYPSSIRATCDPRTHAPVAKPATQPVTYRETPSASSRVVRQKGCPAG